MNHAQNDDFQIFFKFGGHMKTMVNQICLILL